MNSFVDEPVRLEPLDRRVRVLWWLEAALAAALVTVVAGLVASVAPLRWPPGVVAAGVALAGAVFAGVVPALRYRRWRYALRPDDLWLQRGVLWVTVTVVPLARLQFVDTRQGPLDRLLGLAQLVVHTAALGTSARLPGLDADAAEQLRERLARVGPDAAV